MAVFSTRSLRFLSYLMLSVGAALFMLPGIALAGGDPLGTAQTSVDGGFGLITTYGPVLGSMYLLYQLASRLISKYASSSWFAKGKRLALATGALGVVGAALQAQVVGSPWNVIALAAIAAVFKLLTPTVPSTDAPSDPTAGSTSAPTVPLTGALSRAERIVTRGMVLFVLGASLSVLGGSGCGPKSTAVLNAVLDCTTPARNDLVVALTPTAVTAIRKIADPNGKISTEALKALFSGASLNSEAGVLVSCVEARAVEFLATLFSSAPTGTLEQSTTRDQLDGEALREALAGQFPGVVFKTSR